MTVTDDIGLTTTGAVFDGKHTANCTILSADSINPTTTDSFWFPRQEALMRREILLFMRMNGTSMVHRQSSDGNDSSADTAK